MAKLLSQTMMVRLIQANQKAGRSVSIVDDVCSSYKIEGGVMLESDGLLYKMKVGAQRQYVADINTLVNQRQLSIKVTR